MKFCAVLGSHPMDRAGGAEFQSHLITMELASRGHEVHYIAYSSKNEDISLNEGVKIHRLCTEYRPPEVPSEILARIQSVNPDYIYFRNFADLNILKRVSSTCDINTIFNISHDRQCLSYQKDWQKLLNLKNIYRIFKTPRKFFQRKLLSIPDKIFTQTHFQRKLLLDRHNLDSSFIGNGHPVPSQTFPKSDPPIVLWLASLKSWKQPQIFLNLASQLQESNCRFWLVGRPVNERITQKVKKDINDIPNAEYKGSCDINQSNEYIGKSYIFVNTSVREGFPNTFIQAWLRRTLVASLNVDPDGVIQNKEIGVIANGQVERLVEDIQKILYNKELWRKYISRAEEYALENHTIKKIVDRIEVDLSIDSSL